MNIGAHYLGGRCEFIIWAPLLEKLSLHIVFPEERMVPLMKDQRGYWKLDVDNIGAGAKYFYRLKADVDKPDPVSYSQPEGVFGPSEVIDHDSFKWEDQNWQGMPLEEMIIYEFHVGTFTPQGTFEAIIPRLDELCELGINTIEIMPVAQFSGERNWGYDGVFPFAVQNSFGGPEGLKRLVNASHKQNLSVILDVVYNHLGPEGNVILDYMPCITDKYKTPWGQAINFDDAFSDGVRDFFIQNALYWFEHYHIDALRLDAIHGIHDMSAKHFLRELSEKVAVFSKEKKRKVYLIAESDLNDVRVVLPYDKGGHGIDAQWNDDFHHCVHTLLTGENQGYYQDFGGIEHFTKALKEGFVYSWDYSRFRKRCHGGSSRDISASRFVVFSQNHDQVGNRCGGERLPTLVSYEALKLAAGAVFLSAYIPLIFMGEEYGEETPFLYFMSFQDDKLIAAVKKGRKREFESFSWQKEPKDPYDIKTFLGSKINWEKRNEGKHRVLFLFYQKLIQLRNHIPALRKLDKNNLEAYGNQKNKIIFFKRWHNEDLIYSVMNFNHKEVSFKTDSFKGNYEKILDSSEDTWMGPGSQLPRIIEAGKEYIIKPLSFVLYQRV